MFIGVGLALTYIHRLGEVSPADLSALLWWDHASGYVDGTWTDRIAGLTVTQSTAANRPAASSAGLVFDGTNDCLESTNAALLTLIPNDSFEVWALVNCGVTSADANSRYIVAHGDITANTRKTLFRVSTNRYRLQVGTGAGSVTAADSENLPAEGSHVIRSVIGPTTIGLATDGKLPGATACVPSNTDVRLRIGAVNATSPTLFWSGTISHVIITPLLAEDAAIGLWRYLMSRM